VRCHQLRGFDSVRLGAAEAGARSRGAWSV